MDHLVLPAVLPSVTTSIWGNSLAFRAPLAPITPLTEREKWMQRQERYPGFQRGNARVTFDVTEFVLR